MTKITTTLAELTEPLRKALEAGPTPGPWLYAPSIPEDGVNCIWLLGAMRDEGYRPEIGCVDGPQNAQTFADAAYIAAVNPAVGTALLAALDAALAAQGEPVAWIPPTHLEWLKTITHCAVWREDSKLPDYLPLYLGPQPAAAQGEPIAWGQLGTLNGKTYLRLPYERSPYPPPADVVRNLNLVPLYAAPVAQPAPQPLTDSDLRRILNRTNVVDAIDDQYIARGDWEPLVFEFARAIEAELRGIGAAPKEPT